MNEEQHLQALVEMATANQDLILRSENHTDALREIIGASDIVWGIWQDERSPTGVDSMIIKGLGRLMLIQQAARAVAVKMTAVPCREPAEAEAMRQILGDGRTARG
ncbi:conserved hypothetical protein [Hyphomicrobiales bacterium]|nr:conserved hypothetical protein [Hyphomicrobiales bacterium]CAH1677259.1 conserved hypothetical protein [Hyphomicrobiales bacterium]